MRMLALLLALVCAPALAGDAVVGELRGGALRPLPGDWRRGPALVAFWRSDCLPCLVELTRLPEIARDNPALAIDLVALQDAERARAHLPALPANVRVLVASGDGRALLADFGNDRQLALPYSVMLDVRGAVCARHYGILNPERVRTWQETCAS